MVIFENSFTIENMFDDIHKIILDGISSHVCYVVSTEEFGVVSTDNPNKYSYYIIKFTYNLCTIRGGVSIYGRIIEMGYQVSNACYLSFLIQGYKWYAEILYGKIKPVVVAIITVVHPQLYVIIDYNKSKIPTHIYISKADI